MGVEEFYSRKNVMTVPGAKHAFQFTKTLVGKVEKFLEGHFVPVGD